jgi:hypothetical protein
LAPVPPPLAVPVMVMVPLPPVLIVPPSERPTAKPPLDAALAVPVIEILPVPVVIVAPPPPMRPPRCRCRRRCP